MSEPPTATPIIQAIIPISIFVAMVMPPQISPAAIAVIDAIVVARANEPFLGSLCRVVALAPVLRLVPH
jgi:hypothetical protein